MAEFGREFVSVCFCFDVELTSEKIPLRQNFNPEDNLRNFAIRKRFAIHEKFQGGRR